MKLSTLRIFAGLCSVGSIALAGEASVNWRDFEFSEAKSARVAKIAGRNSGEGSFHGYKVASDWHPLEGYERTDLAKILRKRTMEQIAILAAPADGPITLAPLCFEPGYAVHLDTDKGSREFVICLKCSYIYEYDGKSNELGMDPDNGLLIKLKAHYLDEFVLNEADSKSP
jgi:hypothetical protein